MHMYKKTVSECVQYKRCVQVKNTLHVRRNSAHWDLNLYQSALPSIHMWVTKEEFVILYTEFKWRIGVHFGQNAAKNNDILKKCFE